MSTISNYMIHHGIKGLEILADQAGTTAGYLLQLHYNPKKRPSLGLAQRLVQCSDGELTIEGLAQPRHESVWEARKRDGVTVTTPRRKPRAA